MEIAGAHASQHVSGGPRWVESFVNWGPRAIHADFAREICGIGAGTKLKTEENSGSLRSGTAKDIVPPVGPAESFGPPKTGMTTLLFGWIESAWA